MLGEFSIDLDTSDRSKFEFFWIIKSRLKELLYSLIRTEISWSEELVDRIESLHTRFGLILFDRETDMPSDPLIFSLELI